MLTVAAWPAAGRRMTYVGSLSTLLLVVAAGDAVYACATIFSSMGLALVCGESAAACRIACAKRDGDRTPRVARLLLGVVCTNKYKARLQSGKELQRARAGARPNDAPKRRKLDDHS